MSKFVKLTGRDTNSTVIIDTDRVVFVEQHADYCAITLQYGNEIGTCRVREGIERIYRLIK